MSGARGLELAPSLAEWLDPTSATFRLRTYRFLGASGPALKARRTRRMRAWRAVSFTLPGYDPQIPNCCPQCCPQRCSGCVESDCRLV